MSTAIARNFQIGIDPTPSNNFTLYQPATPDGTLRLGVGNTGTTSTFLVLDATGDLGVGTVPSPWGSGLRAIQLGTGSADASLVSIGGNDTSLSTNAYWNALFRYQTTGIPATRYTQTAGQHLWLTAGSGTAGAAISFTQAMTLTAGGVQLLGTTSTPSGGSVASVLARASTTNLQVHSTDGGGALYGGLSGGGAIFYTYTGAVGSETYTERARITSGGFFLFNTTANPTGVWNGNVRFNFQGGIQLTHTGNSNTWRQASWSGDPADAALFFPGGTSLSSVANIAILSAAGAWVNASDGRQKTNVVDIHYGLSTVMEAKPRSFTRIDTPGNYIGFIAQEMKEIIPEVVCGSEAMSYGIDYGSLVAVAFKAIQELKAEFDAYKATHP